MIIEGRTYSELNIWKAKYRHVYMLDVQQLVPRIDEATHLAMTEEEEEILQKGLNELDGRLQEGGEVPILSAAVYRHRTLVAGRGIATDRDDNILQGVHFECRGYRISTSRTDTQFIPVRATFGDSPFSQDQVRYTSWGDVAGKDVPSKLFNRAVELEWLTYKQPPRWYTAFWAALVGDTNARLAVLRELFHSNAAKDAYILRALLWQWEEREWEGLDIAIAYNITEAIRKQRWGARVPPLSLDAGANENFQRMRRAYAPMRWEPGAL